ncbi:MAG: ATP-dependent Clp protease proteolytic subunit [Coriobacteriia bacterium]|nr:ATP-dependent Clp protease proteolytic subunit [Coriobacteriia bacterium]
MQPLEIIWLLVLLAFLFPALQRRLLALRRLRRIQAIEKANGSRLITLIHRQESLSFLGVPLFRFIDIEDSERVLRAIHLTARDVPIQMVLHTPGGLVLASRQIAQALADHPGKVQVVVPYLAMSGGTLIALGADEIVMDPNAVLGPVDPQVRSGYAQYSAASVLRALETPNPNREDATLILGDVAGKAVEQLREFTRRMLSRTLPEDRAQRTAGLLADGRWTHDFPLGVAEARELGLPVNDRFPDEFHELMALYPQPGRRPAVEFIPEPYDKRPEREGE